MRKTLKIKFPQYCDYTCKYAKFTDKCTSGDCRREITIYCKHFKKFNPKHSKCIYYKT